MKPIITIESDSSGIGEYEEEEESEHDFDDNSCMMIPSPLTGVVNTNTVENTNKETNEGANAHTDTERNRDTYYSQERRRIARKRRIWRQNQQTTICRTCDAGCSSVAVASVYCSECARCFCHNCDQQIHDTNRFDFMGRPFCSHHVQYISDGGGVLLLSPLLEISLPIAALILLTRTSLANLLATKTATTLNVDYFFESLCPIIKRLRRYIFTIDHAIYPALRTYLDSSCDIEDAFLKIFTDLWVRAILTRTDSLALLLLKTPKAVGALLLLLSIIPSILAIPYSIFATIIRILEIHIFSSTIITTRLISRIVNFFHSLIFFPYRIANCCCESTIVGLLLLYNSNSYQNAFSYTGQPEQIPPKTGLRKRPIVHNIDNSNAHPISHLFLLLGGFLSSMLRVFRYFYRRARQAILVSIITSVFLAVSARLLLLFMLPLFPQCLNITNGWMIPLLLKSSFAEPSSKHDIQQPQHQQCLTIDTIILRFFQYIGATTFLPTLGSLKDVQERRIVQMIQEATENDYTDELLRRLIRVLFRRCFLGFPLLYRILILILFTLFVFAGFVYRLLFWIDLQQRRRRQQKVQQQGCTSTSGDEWDEVRMFGVRR